MLEALVSADPHERSRAWAEHAISAAYLATAEALTPGVRDALVDDDGQHCRFDAAIRADDRGQWVFAGYAFAQPSMLSVSLAPTTCAASADDEPASGDGAKRRPVLCGHAVSRNFLELSAGDTLLELTLKSRHATWHAKQQHSPVSFSSVKCSQAQALLQHDAVRSFLLTTIELMGVEPFERMRKARPIHRTRRPPPMSVHPRADGSACGSMVALRS
jgi:hypothetical protein